MSVLPGTFHPEVPGVFCLCPPETDNLPLFFPG